MQQSFRKPVTIVGWLHFVPEPLEALTLSSRDLRVDGVKEPEAGE